jgi:hypothetical protein
VAVIGRIGGQPQFERKVLMKLEGCEGSRLASADRAAETSTARWQRTQSLGESGECEGGGEFIKFFNMRLQISVEICQIQIYGALAGASQAHQTRLILQKMLACSPVPPPK